MKVNVIPAIMTIACIMGVILSLDFAQVWNEVGGMHYSTKAVQEDFYIMAMFFAICGMFFISTSFIKKEA